jgi:hypothetical protein
MAGEGAGMELTGKLQEQLQGMTQVGATEAKGKTVKQVVSVGRGYQFVLVFTDDTYMTFTAATKRNGNPFLRLGAGLYTY